ncbi:MAG: B12-binding domain-containing radical SAM protein, partial [Actinomycetota bacterium]|nr:B12-binding domain-containing radical SAM protein [Actinomycetota bacterium]
IEEIAVRSYEVGADLPWFRISAGVSQSYLAREWERAVGGLLTGDCSFDTCTGCGVCGDSGLGVETVLGGEARGSR